jgi:hypothetical protein
MINEIKRDAPIACNLEIQSIWFMAWPGCFRSSGCAEGDALWR